MDRFTRALAAVVASTLVTVGLAAGWAAPADARASSPGHAARADVLSGTTPVISGVAGVGSPLTVSPPDWSLPDVTSSFQWLNDGSPIPGATDQTYVPGVADAGHQIQAAVTGTVDTALEPLTLTLKSAGITIPDPGLPELVSQPELTGNPVVGEVLTVVAPVFSLPGVDTAYQWLNDGAPIPGVTGDTYVPGLEDAGHEISVLVTSTFAGVPILSTVTNVLPIAGAGDDAVSATAAPTVTANPGGPKVGTPVKTSAPTWNEEGVATTYQWLRDGVPINGATTTTYILRPADLGSAISARATGKKQDFSNGVVTSNALTVVVGDAITWTGTQPSVSGTPRAGRLLTAVPGTWGVGDPPLFTYQWKRDGAAIPGAVAQTYQVGQADAGRALSVTITAARAGYKPGTFTTSQTTVAKLVSNLRATTARKTIRKGQRATLALLLKVPGVASPTGMVKVLDGKRPLAKVTIPAGRSGRTTVRIAKLKPGVHKLKAVYAGTSSVAGATSKVVRVTVRK